MFVPRYFLSRAFALGLIIICAFALVWLDPVRATPQDHTDIWFFDIGQGDSFLIQSGSTQILIDGGPTAKVLEKLGRVMPFWDHEIEYVFNTHPHADHVTGLVALHPYYDIGQMYMSPQTYGTAIFRDFVEIYDEALLMQGDEIDFGSGISARVLWPDHREIRSYKDPNAGSLVLLFEIQGQRVLFMGDVGIEEEAQILEHLEGVDILKVGHQGSYTSTSREFLETITPAYAVIPVGENSYGHPHDVVLNRLAEFASQIWRTDQDGDIRMRINPDGVEVGSFAL